MPLNANALTTLETMKQELCLSSSKDDSVLERLINVVSQSVEKCVQRKLFSQTAIVEKVAGFGDTYLHVKVTPLTLITSITFDGVAISATDFSIHDDDGATGAIYNENGWRDTAAVFISIEAERIPGTEQKLYTVTYDGGFVTPEQAISAPPVTLPADLEDVVIQAVSTRFKSLGRDGSVSSEKLEAWSATYGKKTGAELAGSAFPPSLSNILDQYKRAAFA